jgi:hypothetical protein
MEVATSEWSLMLVLLLPWVVSLASLSSATNRIISAKDHASVQVRSDDRRHARATLLLRQ